MKKSMWSNPAGFSIIDLIALAVVFSFLIMGWAVFITKSTDLELLKVYIQPLSIILTGYFSDQVMHRWAGTRFKGDKTVKDDVDIMS